MWAVVTEMTSAVVKCSQWRWMGKKFGTTKFFPKFILGLGPRRDKPRWECSECLGESERGNIWTDTCGIFWPFPHFPISHSHFAIFHFFHIFSNFSNFSNCLFFFYPFSIFPFSMSHRFHSENSSPNFAVIQEAWNGVFFREMIYWFEIWFYLIYFDFQIFRSQFSHFISDFPVPIFQKNSHATPHLNTVESS